MYPDRRWGSYSAFMPALPKNMTDDIFIAEILGHKLLPGCQWGRVIRISMSWETNRETELKFEKACRDEFAQGLLRAFRYHL
jgi:hypothetical protein